MWRPSLRDQISQPTNPHCQHSFNCHHCSPTRFVTSPLLPQLVFGSHLDAKECKAPCLPEKRLRLFDCFLKVDWLLFLLLLTCATRSTFESWLATLLSASSLLLLSRSMILVTASSLGTTQTHTWFDIILDGDNGGLGVCTMQCATLAHLTTTVRWPIFEWFTSWQKCCQSASSSTAASRTTTWCPSFKFDSSLEISFAFAKKTPSIGWQLFLLPSLQFRAKQ